MGWAGNGRYGVIGLFLIFHNRCLGYLFYVYFDSAFAA
jgi:hypothetical protein